MNPGQAAMTGRARTMADSNSDPVPGFTVTRACSRTIGQNLPPAGGARSAGRNTDGRRALPTL